MYAIEVKNLNFGYTPDKQILKDINIQIPYNKFICIVGHNGSGKSTFSKLISGLLMPDSGTIHVCNIPMTASNSSDILNKMGFIFQNPDTQFICITPEDDIAFGLENRKVPSSIIKEIIKEIAEFFDITSILETNPALLSGGQKQKVAIASVLATNQEIIIFDESTSMLDSKNKREIQSIMSQLVTKQNKTVISITHDMEELLLADEIIVFKNGRIEKYSKDKSILYDNDFLKDYQLSPPFIYKLNAKLKENNVKLSNFNNEEELINLLETH